MKIVPLAWIRNARDNLPKNLYRRAPDCDTRTSWHGLASELLTASLRIS